MQPHRPLYLMQGDFGLSVRGVGNSRARARSSTQGDASPTSSTTPNSALYISRGRGMSFSTLGSGFSKRASRKQTLNILVCGASGTGKSSFINTLVGKRVILESENQATAAKLTALRFQPTSLELDEPLSDGSRLTLTLIETEGFGTSMKHASDIQQVAEYIENRFDEVLAEESRIRRNPRFKDNRIDACLYFIEPTGHGLRELDILTLKRLAGIVNVIPVIGRADALTQSERVTNKRLIMEDFRFHDIELFDFQYSDEGNTAGGAKTVNSEGDIIGGNIEDNELFGALPFALSSSSEFDEQGISLYKRLLPFGTVEVLNPHHSDLRMLRDALIDEFLMELKERTHDVLYETFRTHRLDPQQNHRASLLMPQELAEHAARLKQAQIDRETALLREEELRVNSEIEAKRAMLLKRERELRELEQKMAETRPYNARSSYESDSRQSSQPSSATSSKFTFNQPGQTPLHSTNPFATSQYSDPVTGSQSEVEPAYDDAHGQYVGQPIDPNSVDGYIDRPAENFDSELRIRQSRSQKELREHTDKLHAELGDLEAHKQDIQRQVASATSSNSLRSQVAGSERPVSTTYPIAEHANEGQIPGGSGPDRDTANTTPLNIKKTAAA